MQRRSPTSRKGFGRFDFEPIILFCFDRRIHGCRVDNMPDMGKREGSDTG